jgi:hypothetical protein
MDHVQIIKINFANKEKLKKSSILILTGFREFESIVIPGNVFALAPRRFKIKRNMDS